jgi:hypothetical protein
VTCIPNEPRHPCPGVLIAVLPTMVMATGADRLLHLSRLSDLEEAHIQRGKALARQLAAASEYGVFSGNLESLRKLSQRRSLIERTWFAWSVISPLQEILADSSAPPDPTMNGTTQPLLFREPVTGPGVNIEDPSSRTPAAARRPPADQRGEVLVEMSRDSLRAEEQRLLRNAFLMVVAVLIASVALALRMSRGISGPILRIASTVASFGQGNSPPGFPSKGARACAPWPKGSTTWPTNWAPRGKTWSGRSKPPPAN